eukprot:2236630-Rhodomonas_salina.1
MSSALQTDSDMRSGTVLTHCGCRFAQIQHSGLIGHTYCLSISQIRPLLRNRRQFSLGPREQRTS